MSEAKTDSLPKRPNIFRRRYWIDQSIQLPIIVYFLGVVGLSFAIFAALFFFGYNDYIEIFRNELPGGQYAVVEMQLMDGRDLAIDIFSYCSVFALACSVLGGLFLSHRVAGPIYRLRMTLKQIAIEKKPATVRFRKGDYTHELADDFNEAMRALETR